MIATDFAPDPARPLPLQQSAAYAATLHTLGQPAEHRRAGAIAALVAPAMGLAATIRGPFAVDDSSPDAAPDHGARAASLCALGLRMIEAEAPCPSLRRAGFACVVTPTHVAEWSLAQRPQARRAGLHGKWRNALVRAEGAGLHVREEAFDAAPGHWLFRETRALARTRGFRPLPQAFTLAFVVANPGQARLWTAWDRPERPGALPLAAMLFLRHGPVATYHLGWTSDAGRAACAHHLLLSQAADWLADRDTARLDLGIVDTESAPGLARFKLGVGAVARPLGGAWLRLPGLSRVVTTLAHRRL